jgi:putative endonuclease
MAVANPITNMFCVYVLRDSANGKHYIGYTRNLKRRLREHIAGKTKSLRSAKNLQLVLKEEYLTKEEAYRRERQIKSYKGGNAFKKLLEFSGR